jgi:hypothetical protein
VRETGGISFLARWPTRKAAQHARDRIRFMTMRARLAAPVEQVVQEINLFLRGCAGYFRYGNSARAFDKIRGYALMRVALFIAKPTPSPPSVRCTTRVLAAFGSSPRSASRTVSRASAARACPLDRHITSG